MALRKTHKSSGAQKKVWNDCTFCTVHTLVHFGQRDTRCLTFFCWRISFRLIVRCAMWISCTVELFACALVCFSAWKSWALYYYVMHMSSIINSGVTTCAGNWFLFPFHMFVSNVQTQPLNWSRRNDGGDGLDVRDKGATHCMSRMGFCNERKVKLLSLQ